MDHASFFSEATLIKIGVSLISLEDNRTGNDVSARGGGGSFCSEKLSPNLLPLSHWSISELAQ